MTDFYNICSDFSKTHKPTTVFQKQYGRKLEYKGKVAWQFPGHKDRLPEIDKSVRISQGTEPTSEEYSEIQLAWKSALDTETGKVFGYVPIWVLTYFVGKDVSSQLIWLVKNGKAQLNVDRLGRGVYFKLK